jgi:hypothetical protein
VPVWWFIFVFLNIFNPEQGPLEGIIYPFSIIIPAFFLGLSYNAAVDIRKKGWEFFDEFIIQIFAFTFLAGISSYGKSEGYSGLFAQFIRELYAMGATVPVEEQAELFYIVNLFLACTVYYSIVFITHRRQKFIRKKEGIESNRKKDLKEKQKGEKQKLNEMMKSIGRLYSENRDLQGSINVMQPKLKKLTDKEKDLNNKIASLEEKIRSEKLSFDKLKRKYPFLSKATIIHNR